MPRALWTPHLNFVGSFHRHADDLIQKQIQNISWDWSKKTNINYSTIVNISLNNFFLPELNKPSISTNMLDFKQLSMMSFYR
jgi:hypothetical protein